MAKSRLLLTVIIFLEVFLGSSVQSQDYAFEYPCYFIDSYDADNSCWTGMDADGVYEGPIRVVPEQWLVGPPLSEKSGVTLPPDHWVEVQFRGPIVDGPDDDILLIELGPVSEQALIFLTDGAGREYLLGIATSGTDGSGVDPTEIGFDISNVDLPFTPRAIRILGIDLGGGAPGFDIASIRARICAKCEEIACSPVPIDGAVNVPTDIVLSWSPGYYSGKHNVFFAEDLYDIGPRASPISDPIQPQDINNYDPNGLELDKTYYWRIDEVNDTNTWSGNIWSFKTADHIVVDDFEHYNYLNPNDPNSNRFSDVWKQANVTLCTEPTRGCGKKTMAFYYYYYCTSVYSEAVRTFSPAQDWAAAGVKVLELFFLGSSYNNTAQMYLVLNDGNSETIIPYSGDANDIRIPAWQPWRIELHNLSGLNLSNIESIAIGFCSEIDKPYSSGIGNVYFDDIRLYSSICMEENRSKADFDCDCEVGFRDLEKMADEWLDSSHKQLSITTPNSPLAWYKFDNDTQDSIGSAHGQINSSPVYTQGVHGQAISFEINGDYVELTGVSDLFAIITKGLTIAFWQYGTDSSHLTDTICCTNYIYGQENPAIAINLGCWKQPGKYIWDCGYPWSFSNRLSGNHRHKSEWSGRWNHWTFTKDFITGTMQIFLNGFLYDSRTGSNSPISEIKSFVIGSGWYGSYDGLIDDFQIYDYALSQTEAAYLATNGTGIIDLPLITPADLLKDDHIDFKDFAILADSWLENQLIP
jgi:hypothetical protein